MESTALQQHSIEDTKVSVMRTTRAICVFVTLACFTLSTSTAQELAYLLGDEATNLDDFGRSVADAGDINFDGYPDVLVGAPLDSAGGTTSGSVFIYSGRTGELLWTRTGDNPGDLFGWSVDGLGDLNGDGASDIIVGAPLYDNGGLGQSGGGRVYVLSPATDTIISDSVSNVLNNQIGTVVRALGDINGDSIADYAYGAHQYDSGGLTDRGAVFAFSGANHSSLWVRFGQETDEYYGFSIDVIRNGNAATSRVIIGAPKFNAGGFDRGRIVIVNGSGNLVSSINGTSNAGWLGHAVAGIGDINGDGTNDYAASYPYADQFGIGADAGLVRAFSGQSGGILINLSGPHAGARLGQALAGFGDFNGDSVPDLLIGSPNLNFNGITASGEARVVSGTNGATLASFSAGLNDHTGRSVSSAGDINQDGVRDIVIGIPDAPFGAGQAEVRLSQTTAPTIYCTAKVNSQGCTPAIQSEGLPSAGIANSFRVTASNVLNQQLGLLLWGRSAIAQPFMGGTLCVGAPQTRTTAQSAGGTLVGNDCTGTYAFHFSHAYMASKSILPGDQIFAQYWSRDTADPMGVGLTDAVAFEVIP